MLGTALARLTGAQETPAGPVDTRPAGTTRLEGRPLDDNGGIELTKVRGSTLTVPASDFEELYQRIKRRLIDECRVDPILLHMLATSAPELQIDIEPLVIELKEDSLRGRMCILIGQGFYDSPRTSGETSKELRRTGTDPAGNRLSEAFTSLVNDGALTREDSGYQKAPGVKVTERKLTTA